MKRLPSIPLALALALAAAALASSSSSGAAMSAPLLSSPLLHKAHASHHTTSHRPAWVDIIGNIIDASSPPSSMRMRRRPIAFAFRRFHRIARFDVEKRRARASTITITTATAMAATFPNGGDLYDDDELRDVLALHESIRTPTTNANGARDVILARGGGASSDDGGDHGDAGSMTSGGIHDWVLRALEDDGPTMGGGERLGGGGGGCGGGGSGYDIDVESSSVSSDGNDAPSDAMYGGIHDWVLRALEDDGPTSISSGIHDVVTIPTTTPRDDAMGRSDNDQDVGYEMLSISGGIHDWVLWELENDVGVYDDDAGGGVGCLDEWGRKDDDDNDDDELPSSSFSANQLAYDNLRTLLRDRKPHIRAIATDVDGTLLSGRYLHPITRDAMLRGIRKAYDIGPTTDNDDCVADDGGSIRHFFPATGKSRAGAIISLGPDIGSLLLNIPGVYVQGLYCVDGNGNVIFEKRLPTSAIRAAERLASEYGLSVVAYDGDDLYTTDRTDIVVRLSEYHGEPEVNLLIDEVSGRPMELADHVPGAHKLLLMHDDLEKLAIVRSRLEEVASTHDATVTVALPTMLELLPAGCSKAYGVERVCEALGVDPTAELLALGDAENDSEMLRMASIGVAVGNACPIAKDAADFVMRERNDEGGAGLAMNLFGF